MQLCIHYLHVHSLYVYNGLIFVENVSIFYSMSIWIQGIIKCSQL